MDLSGKRFGRLTVIKEANKKRGYNKFYLCKCDCGKYTKVINSSLTNGDTKSCGCLQKETISKIGKENIENNSKKRIEIDKKYNTNFGMILKPNEIKTNTSGFKGVSFNNKRNKFEAYLQIHGKKKFLGRYNEIEDAIAARIDGEEKYFKPIIESAIKNKDLNL